MKDDGFLMKNAKCGANVKLNDNDTARRKAPPDESGGSKPPPYRNGVERP